VYSSIARQAHSSGGGFEGRSPSVDEGGTARTHSAHGAASDLRTTMLEGRWRCNARATL